MRVLFAHQNYPAQFVHLAPALKRAGADVAALTMNAVADPKDIAVVQSRSKHSTSATHPWARDFETKIIRAEATLRSARFLRDKGFSPDVIVAHPGWGDTMFLKTVWPEARLGLYCEYFYRTDGGDHQFDPEFPKLEDPLDASCNFQLRNLHQRWHFDLANGAMSPTRFQASTYPAHFRPKIDVIHDGIDTARLRPDPSASVRVPSGLKLTRDQEVITFVSRNLEPYRGYHILMRALPDLLRRRPDAHVLIVGGDGVSYGAQPPAGRSWKSLFLDEVADRVDPSRVHFLGNLPYEEYLRVLQVSRLHVYLTYPFVLSWSLMEAMALGAPILASDTAPLREVVIDGENGLLFPFLEPAALVEGACRLLGDEALRHWFANAGRDKARREYDLRTVCLPRQLAWVDRLYRAFPVTPEPD